MSRLNMDFHEKEDKIIQALNEEYGIKQTTELIRFIVKDQYKRMKVGKHANFQRGCSCPRVDDNRVFKLDFIS